MSKCWSIIYFFSLRKRYVHCLCKCRPDWQCQFSMASALNERSVTLSGWLSKMDREMERSVLTDGIWPGTKNGFPITRLCKQEALQPEILALHLCGACHDRHWVLTSTSLIMNQTENTSHAISLPMTAYSLGVGACQRLSTHLKALLCFRWCLHLRNSTGPRTNEECLRREKNTLPCQSNYFNLRSVLIIQKFEVESEYSKKKRFFF